MGKRGLPRVSCDSCRARKVRCDREDRFAQGGYSCSDCASRNIECTINASSLPNIPDTPNTQAQGQIGVKRVKVDSIPKHAHVQVIKPDDFYYSLRRTQVSSATPANTAPSAQPLSDGHGHGHGHGHAHASRPTSTSNNPHSSDESTSPYFPPSLDKLDERILQQDQTGPGSNHATPFDPPSLSSAASASASETTPAQTHTQPRLNCLNRYSKTTSDLVQSAPRHPGLFHVPGLDKTTLDTAVNAYFEFVSICTPILVPEHFWARYKAYFAMYAATNSRNPVNPDIEPLSELLILAVAARGMSYTKISHKFELQQRIISQFRSMCHDGQRVLQDGYDSLEALIILSDASVGPDYRNGFALESPDPFRIEPLSHDGQIQLALKLGLNRATIVGDPNSPELVRQRTILLFLWANDCFKRGGPGTRRHLRDGEVDIPPLPVRMGEGFLGEWFNSIITLSNIARDVANTCFNPHSSRVGVSPTALVAFYSKLRSWYSAHVNQVSWSGAMERNKPTLVRKAFLRMMWLSLHMMIECYASLFGLETNRGSGSNESELREATQQVRAETSRVFCNVVDLARDCARLEVLDYNMLILRNVPAGCANWGILHMERAVRESRPALAENLATKVEVLIQAVATATSYPDTQALVAELARRLDDARPKFTVSTSPKQQAGSRARATSESSPSSNQPPAPSQPQPQPQLQLQPQPQPQSQPQPHTQSQSQPVLELHTQSPAQTPSQQQQQVPQTEPQAVYQQQQTFANPAAAPASFAFPQSFFFPMDPLDESFTAATIPTDGTFSSMPMFDLGDLESHIQAFTSAHPPPRM